jgi:hypothetical protein
MSTSYVNHIPQSNQLTIKDCLESINQRNIEAQAKKLCSEIPPKMLLNLRTALNTYNELSKSKTQSTANILEQIKKRIETIEQQHLAKDPQLNLNVHNELLKIHAEEIEQQLLAKNPQSISDPTKNTENNSNNEITQDNTDETNQGAKNPSANQLVAIGKILLKRFADLEKGENTKAPSHDHTHAEGHDHDHADGVVIDLDEAVHGVYASTKYLISALKGNPQHILDEFNRDAHDLANTTLPYLRDELVPHGIGEFAAGVGVSAIMLPLAYMAAKAGLEEMHHASHEIKDLKRHQSKLEGIQRNLETMNEILESNYLLKEAKVVDSKASVLQRAVKQSKRDWKIGLCSFGSGLSIGTKALSDIGLKVSLGVQGLLTGKGFLGASQVISASTPAALVTTVLGAASTFVLGPLAGLFATGLGAYFTRKSSSKKNQLRTDFGIAAEQLNINQKTGKANASSTETNTEETESSTPKNTDQAFNTYKEFIGRQGKRRIGFFKGFTRWNKAFMIGSGLYAASATTKAVVAGLALGGIAAAASNPIGLGIITAVGTIGALGMGIASYCFITGHGKQGKYAKHTAGDDKLVDRDLLVRAQTHALEGNGIEEQVKLASACLTRLNARKDAIRTFLNAAAKSSKNKKGVNKISPFLLTTDGKKTDGKKTDDAKKDKAQQLTLWKRMKGQALNVKDVETFIQSLSTNGIPSGDLLTFATADLGAEKAYLTAQRNAIQTLLNQAKDTKIEPGQTDEDTKLAATRLFVHYTDEQLTDKYKAIQDRLTKTEDLQSQLEQPTDKTTLLKTLLQHWGVEVEKGQKNENALADYLLKDVDKELRNARGVLFEAQLQASQLVKQQTTAQHNKTEGLQP